MYFFILSAFCIVLSIAFAVLTVKYRSLDRNNTANKNDIEKLLILIKRIRYGNINIKAADMHNKELENTINRLIETIYDREIMIREYQSTLADKNVSLEEIIKNEKQLRAFKDEFTATLTHDMKVPVIAELNSINFLLDGRFGNLNDKQKDVLNLMKNSNQELKDLIENLVETYKLEHKTLELNLTLNNFNEFLESIIQEMIPISNSAGVNIIAKLNLTDGIKIYFDFFQLKRVIKNLIHNAISYSKNSTDIIIETNLSDNYLIFKITNKGICISEEDLGLIFQKYYSGHSKFKNLGTGLGLYLSHIIMTAHKGEISVKSTPDGYTTFLLNIPAG